MGPKILVFSHKKILYQLLSEYLDEQYEIVYCDKFLKNHDLMLSEQNVCLCIIGEFSFSREIGQLVQKIKKKRKTPVLFLSGTKHVGQRIEEKVQAIDYGVDEYLAHLQSMDEILASVKALVRWHLRISDNVGKWVYRDLILYPKSRRAFREEAEVPLTKIEYDIVQYLASQNGRVVSYKELYEKVWKHEYILDDQSIMAHIHRIRKKLEPQPQKPVYIHNVYGMGYRFGAASDIETAASKGCNLHPLSSMI